MYMHLTVSNLIKLKSIFFILNIFFGLHFFANASEVEYQCFDSRSGKLYLSCTFFHKDEIIEDFKLAMVNRNYTVVESAVKSGVNINDLFFEGRSALYLASEEGRVNDVKILLSLGAISKGPPQELDALEVAALRGHAEVVKILVLNNKDEKTINSALYYAASWSNLEIVKLLLDLGADINSYIIGGKNLLTYFTSLSKNTPENIQRIETLISYGADVNRTDMKGNLPLITAIEKGDEELVKLFVRSGADVNKKNNSGYTSLMIAVKSLLLTESSDRKGFYYSNIYPNINIVRILINNGANVNELTPDGNSILMLLVNDHLRVFENREDISNIIMELLLAGADRSIVNRYNYTVIDLVKNSINSKGDLNDKKKSLIKLITDGLDVSLFSIDNSKRVESCPSLSLIVGKWSCQIEENITSKIEISSTFNDFNNIPLLKILEEGLGESTYKYLYRLGSIDQKVIQSEFVLRKENTPPIPMQEYERLGAQNLTSNTITTLCTENGIKLENKSIGNSVSYDEGRKSKALFEKIVQTRFEVGHFGDLTFYLDQNVQKIEIKVDGELLQQIDIPGLKLAPIVCKKLHE